MHEPNLPPLSPAQREVMEIIWQRGAVTVNEVRGALAPRRKLARNTVQTMLVRLEEKGWLRHETNGRAFVYSAKLPRRVNLGAKVTQIVERFFAGSPEAMVNALLEYRGLSKDEAARIRKMIQAAEKSAKSERREGTT